MEKKREAEVGWELKMRCNFGKMLSMRADKEYHVFWWYRGGAVNIGAIIAAVGMGVKSLELSRIGMGIVNGTTYGIA